MGMIILFHFSKTHPFKTRKNGWAPIVVNYSKAIEFVLHKVLKIETKWIFD